jgi:hypothetical protein
MGANRMLERPRFPMRFSWPRCCNNAVQSLAGRAFSACFDQTAEVCPSRLRETAMRLGPRPGMVLWRLGKWQAVINAALPQKGQQR